MPRFDEVDSMRKHRFSGVSCGLLTDDTEFEDDDEDDDLDDDEDDDFDDDDEDDDF